MPPRRTKIVDFTFYYDANEDSANTFTHCDLYKGSGDLHQWCYSISTSFPYDMNLHYNSYQCELPEKSMSVTSFWQSADADPTGWKLCGTFETDYCGWHYVSTASTSSPSMISTIVFTLKHEDATAHSYEKYAKVAISKGTANPIEWTFVDDFQCEITSSASAEKIFYTIDKNDFLDTGWAGYKFQMKFYAGLFSGTPS